MKWRGLMVLCALAVLGIMAGVAHAQEMTFGQWQDSFAARARAAGVPQAVIDQNIAPLQPDDEVIALDHKQPEDKLSFSDYVKHTVNARRIAKGRELMAENHALLHKVAKTFDVEPRYIVALWGMETDYGAHAGNYSVLQSLATLAYDGRRRDLFEDELIDALKIINGGQWSSDDLVGSWAGAMGNCQFMPSSYLKYAVDFDGDGKADIWNSLPDSFASIANYLHQSGWVRGIGWGQASDADDAVYPGEKEEGGYAVTSNYAVLLKWNRSRYFATSVGLLADQLGQP